MRRRTLHIAGASLCWLLGACSATDDGPDPPAAGDGTIGSTGGDVTGGDDTGSDTESNIEQRWIPIPHLPSGACQALWNPPPGEGLAKGNHTIASPLGLADLVEFVVTDYEAGDVFFPFDGTPGYVPAGTFIGDLGFTCTYRAPYDAYEPLVEHFASGFTEPGVGGAFTWVGGEQVGGLQAAWELQLTNGASASPETSGAWLLLFPRYQATVMRCMDPNYPPEVEEGTGKELKNNAVCASITDGGKRALLDFKLAAEGVDFPQDEYDALAGGDPGLTMDAQTAVECIQNQMGPLSIESCSDVPGA